MVLMVVRYADIIRWQIRAQNAADAAAQAVVALQTQQFNEMNSLLYASAVEEYRIRQILYALELTAYGNGGCSLDGSCSARFAQLRVAYDKAVNRYTNEVQLLNRVTANMDYSTLQSDAHALIAEMQNSANCGNPGGGDCAFGYALVGFGGRAPLYNVAMDARAFIKPSLGMHMTAASGVNPSLVPVQVEVAVCADIPSPVPAIGNFQPPPMRVIARAAATAVMVEQDWLQPGSLNNFWTGTLYQPLEAWSGSAGNDGSGTDWYSVNFGGNASTANTQANGYTFGIFADEFSAYTGWWNTVAIRPYAGALSTSSLGCAS
jgi:hypothetical protein